MEKDDSTRVLRRFAATLGAWTAAAALLAASAVQNRALTGRRLAGGAGIAPRPSEPPPALTFVVVGLGAFRGLAAEALWFRADQLQQEGRYFELVQLAGWITALDPHAADAWAYNAWNLSYNISALMLRREDRLRWVFHGVRLLRDEALTWNPGNAQLCRELAWLYLHKVGGALDDAAPLYRRTLAAETAPLLGANGAYPETAAARESLRLAWRLEAARVVTLEKETGPLDWRAPESHALYWALAGLAHADDPAERFKCRRLACHALMALYEQGRRAAGDTPGASATPPRAVSDRAIFPALLRLLAEHYAASPTASVRRLYGIHLVHGMRQAAAAGDGAERDRLYSLLLNIAAKGFMISPMDELLKQGQPDDAFLAPRAAPSPPALPSATPPATP